VGTGASMTETIDAVLADWQGSLDAMRWAPDLPEEPVPADSFYDQQNEVAEEFNPAAADWYGRLWARGVVHEPQRRGPGIAIRSVLGENTGHWTNGVVLEPVRVSRAVLDDCREQYQIWREHFSRLVNRFIRPNLWDQQQTALAPSVVPEIGLIGWLDEIAPPVILISPADRMPWELSRDPELGRCLPPGVVLDGQTLRFAETILVQLPGIRPHNARLLEDR
jgi:hypothetical protein